MKKQKQKLRLIEKYRVCHHQTLEAGEGRIGSRWSKNKFPVYKIDKRWVGRDVQHDGYS